MDQLSDMVTNNVSTLSTLNMTPACPEFPEQQDQLEQCHMDSMECHDPEYYGTLYSMIGTVFQTAIFLAGVCGNVMVVVTVRGTKSLHTTTNCYLVSLALSDMITLLSSVPQVYN